jgi:addiction module HigA family antidote
MNYNAQSIVGLRADSMGFRRMSEIVEPCGRSITDVAAEIGLSRQALSTVLNGHASLSADMALRFERQFKIGADTLIRMQTSYDLEQARLQLAGCWCQSAG